MMLTIEELPANLRNAVTYHEITANQILFQQGEPTKAIYWVESGRWEKGDLTPA